MLSGEQRGGVSGEQRAASNVGLSGAAWVCKCLEQRGLVFEERGAAWVCV